MGFAIVYFIKTIKILLDFLQIKQHIHSALVSETILLNRSSFWDLKHLQSLKARYHE